MKNYFFAFLFFSSFVFAQTYSLSKVSSIYSNHIVFVKHTFYEIGFNTKYHLPAWTFYSLTKEHLALASLNRKGSFVKDPALKAVQAKSSDYSSSGLDKGHMVPCEDMSFTETSMQETFYYSNCAPQTTELNRGEWKMLEELSRNWAKEFGEVIVISGPVFKNPMKTIGETKIPVPNEFYKIIVRHDQQHYKAICFVLPNVSTPISGIQNYVCSVDSVEKLTGLNFFSDLPDTIEEQFESSFNQKDWNFEYHHHHLKNENDTVNPKAVSVQCKAKTKKGVRCKKITTRQDGYCEIHHK